jgi:hypothetical protein
MEEQSLVERLRVRAYIRRQIPTRKSVQENKPDRLADLLEEAARRIEMLESKYEMQTALLQQFTLEAGRLRSALDFLQEHPCWIGKMSSGKTTLECVLPDGQFGVVANNLREAIRSMKKEQ